MTKTHTLTRAEFPAAIAAWEEMGVTKDALKAQHEEMIARHQKELTELQEEVLRQHVEVWRKLTDAAGLPPTDGETGFGYRVEMEAWEKDQILVLKEIDPNVDDCQCEACIMRRKMQAGGDPPSLGQMLAVALLGAR